MEISGSFGLGGVNGLNPASRGNAASKPQPTSSVESIAPTDILDLSSDALSISPPSSGDIRTEKVADIRRAIADGTYDTDEKLSAALDKLLEQIG